MSITSAIVLYSICWFMTLFMVLPQFVRSQEEAGEVEPGTPAGAPDQALMKKKLVWTTIIATTVFAIVVCVIEFEVITVDDLARWTGQDLKFAPRKE